MTPTLATPDAPPTDDRDDMIAAGVVCPRCERRSLDESFCEHCQFELPPPTTELPTHVAGSPESAIWSLASLGVGWPDDPSASFQAVSGPTALRVRAIRPELWPAVVAEVRARQAVSLRGLPPIQVLETGGGALVLAEAWLPDATDEVSSSSKNVDELVIETLRECRQLDAALTELHASGHVWLEFDPNAVEVKGEQLRFTNLDWRLFPFGRCPSRLARISPRYSPPEVCQFRDEFIGPRTDVFHLALSAYYRLAGLRDGGFAGRGLESFGFEVPSLRIFRPDLPAGIWPVLRRALSINASHRPASTGELMDELERAVSRRGDALKGSDDKIVATFARTWDDSRDPHVLANVATSDERAGTAPGASEPSLWQRVVRRLTGDAAVELSDTSANDNDLASSTTSLRPTALDVGWQTIAGRAKTALGAVNQDCAVVLREPVRDREMLLMIVADGVTHARVGAGERASGLACEVLVASIRAQIRSCSPDVEPEWSDILDRACRTASEAIVTDALSIPDRPARISDNDLMSTTALIGVLDGNELHLANVGDSRAYLVANGIAEQLTVDGDVAASQLAQGTPPEQVQELGSAGKALRYCLGACREGDDGQLAAELERARPQIGHWRVEPGDTFILCSDGLVEERVFLEPEDLVRIVETNGDLAAPGDGRVGQAHFERRPTIVGGTGVGGPALEASLSHPTECSAGDSKVLLRSTTSQELAEQMVAAADARQRMPSEREPNGYGDNITCIVLRLVEGPPPHDASSRKG